MLDIIAAGAALAGDEIELEIGIAAGDLIERLNGGRRERRASEIRVNDNTGAVDHRLDSVGATVLDGGADKIDNRIPVGDFAGGPEPGKFAPDKIDNHRPRQIDFA